MSTNISQPLISVCIPAYNNESFINQTIDCILNQTYQNWELIISDDCSNDKTVEIIKTYKDPRIRLIERKQNLGLVGNWNSLIPELKGEYTKLLCGDDLIERTCLEKQISVFLTQSNSHIALVTSHTDLINEAGVKLMTKKFPFKSGLINSKKAISANFLFGTNKIGEPGCGLFKTDLFKKVGEYDKQNNYMVDLDFWFRILLTGNLYVIPESLASFRINTHATTTKTKNSQAKLFIQFVKKIYKDKRYSVSLILFYHSCIAATMMQYLRMLFLKIFLK
jgi:glycosyltransferase involved in cell wall biosynthesis